MLRDSGRYLREYAERNGVSWLALSAKQGLFAPDTHVEPYDLTLDDLSLTEKGPVPMAMSRVCDQQCRGSFGGAQAVQGTGPLKDTTVSGHQLVACERSRHDDAISRVAVETPQIRGTDSDITVYRDLGYTLVDLLSPPRPYVIGEPEPPLSLQHRDLPERDR